MDLTSALVPSIFPPVISLIGVIVTAVLVYRVNRRTSDAQSITAEAEASASASEEWRNLYSEMRSRLDVLEKRFDTAESRAEEAERQAEMVSRELDVVFKWIESGMPPPPPVRPLFLIKKEPH